MLDPADSRVTHIERLITPTLLRGAWVVSDRFHDSSRAYQGAAGGAPVALIDALEHNVLDGLKPDLTLILDLPVAQGLARAAMRDDGEARFEAKGEEFPLFKAFWLERPAAGATSLVA